MNMATTNPTSGKQTAAVVTPPAGAMPADSNAAADRQDSILNPVCKLPQGSPAEQAPVFSNGTEEQSTRSRENTNLTALKRELQYYRGKAIEQDIEIFEMRALLQSGKGLSNILNLKQLLETFMAVVREKYSAINTSVLLRDDLENAQDFYRVKAFYGLDDKFIQKCGLALAAHSAGECVQRSGHAARCSLPTCLAALEP
jgi:hypothetical protein